MAHFMGLDVSVQETSVCVVDDVGKVLCERKVRTEPEDIAVLLTSIGGDYVRIGIEAGPLSQWLVNGLTKADLPVVCVETRHMKALLKAQQVNKSDRNDARGIAQMMRVGLFKPVHVKTLIAQEQRMLLTSRKLVQRKLMDIESDMRGTLRNFGLKVGVVSSIRDETRIRDLVEGFPRLAAIIEPLLTVRRVMRQQLAKLHKLLLNAVRVDPVCRRFMTVPGVIPSCFEAVAPTRLGDCEIKANDQIFVWSQAAMLDRSAFPNPQELRPDRPAAAYLHFGGGLHPCAGRVVNAFQIPLLVGALVRRGIKSVGSVEWAGPYPDHVAVEFER